MTRWAVDLVTRQIARVPPSALAAVEDVAAELFALDADEARRRCAAGEIRIGTLAEVWRHVLDRLGSMPFEILTRSMVPTLVPGEKVRIEPLPAAPASGAIVLVAQPHDGGERLVVHRLLAHLGSTVLLQGDNSPEPDPPLAASQMIGVATGVRRRLRPRLRALRYYAGRGKWARSWSIVTATWTRRWRGTSPPPSPPRPASHRRSRSAAPPGGECAGRSSCRSPASRVAWSTAPSRS